MSKIKIITDSGSDITREVAEKLGIRMLPISFTFDGENYYKEGIDMNKNEFYEKLTSKDAPVPKTAQVTPIQFIDAYNEEFDNGYDVLIVVTISSKGSGMHQNAVMAAQEVMDERGGEIIVIDTMGYSCMYGGAVIHAAKMIENGQDKDEIVAYIKDATESMKAYFLVEDLLYLKKGGRINSATLAIANMLDIKPVLDIKDGLVVQDGKIRGNKRITKKLVDKAKNDGYDLSGKTVYLVNSACPDTARELGDALSEAFPGIKFIELRIGAVIASHGGPGLVGFVFSQEYDFDDYEG